MRLFLKAIFLTLIIVILSSLSIIDSGIMVKDLWRIFPENAVWMIIVCGFGLGIAFIVYLKRPKKELSVNGDSKGAAAFENSAASSLKSAVNQNHVIHFFLGLYKRQLGADETAPSQIRTVDVPQSQSIGLDRTVELRVQHRGQWESRRMSIGPLGEESGSKSKCYYVIYNINMVVKIPPKPIKKFNKYVEMIRADSRIVSQLAPKICIVPKISVIQRHLHQFYEEDRYSPNELEEKYIDRLKKIEPDQDYLKIGGSFVFFMDLSKHYFLGLIISRLHDDQDKLNQELNDQGHLIWKMDGFEGRYGQQYGANCLALQSVYNNFEKEIIDIAKQYEKAATIDVYLIKKWFLALLGEKDIDFEALNLSGSMISQLRQTVSIFKEEDAKHLDAYRTLIKAYVGRVSFSQNRSSFEGIITNLIELLSWLQEKGVAMRDLKPDNILVAGDPTQFPHFLKFVEKFTIGLIDVETAVIFKDVNTQMKQPQLGGTPFYATPSHILKNEYLKALFGDVGLILHHQDWHAILVIIFKVITGLRLFDRSGKLFSKMVKSVRDKSFAAEDQLEKNVEAMSRLFWATARAEFQHKTNLHKELLKTIQFKVLKNNFELFREKVSKEKAFLDKLIHAFVTKQPFFKSVGYHKQFLNASAKKVLQFAVKWEKDDKTKNLTAQQKNNVLIFLKDLQKLKEKKERYVQFLEEMKGEHATISVYDGLYMMFDINLSVNYQKKWGLLDRVPLEEDSSGRQEPISEATL